MTGWIEPHTPRGPLGDWAASQPRCEAITLKGTRCDRHATMRTSSYFLCQAHGTSRYLVEVAKR